MKKLLILLFLLLLAIPSYGAINFYGATATTGGATGSLDSINGDLLNDGDVGIVADGNKAALFYVLDATSGAAESGDDIIAPDTNPGTKRWIKQKLHAADPTDIHGVGDRAFNDARYLLLSYGEYTTIYIAAGAFIPTTTNGAATGTFEYVTNDIMHDYLAFDGTTEEFAAVNFVMPEAWDRLTVKAKIHWAPGDSAASAADTVEWELAGGAISDDDAIDTAPGTAQVVSDAVLVGVEGDMHITSATPAITVGGTPALGDMVQWKISRNVSGTDDMTEDAWLFGIEIQLKIGEAVSAW